MKTPSIFQSAIDNWPEDEAMSLADAWKDYRDEYGAQWEPKVRRDIAHMEEIFSEDDNGPAFIARYRTVITKELGLAF